VDAEERKAYLRSHVHGLEFDEFAIEIARLSLTLADIPNPNGWDLQQGDMFASDVLNREVARAGLILANPPFENFAAEDRQRYAQRGWPTSQVNKAAELVARILRGMKDAGAVLGLVVPQGFLRSKGAEDVRAALLRDFEIREVCLFPDKVFTFADSESAVLLARRSEVSAAHRANISFRAVREPDWTEFRTAYRVTWAQSVPAKRFAEQPLHSLRLPELDEVWAWLGSLPRLLSIAEVGQGLVFHSRHLPRGVEPFSKRKRVGDVPGFEKVPRRWMIHELPPRVSMTTSRDAIRRLLSGGYTGKPQVIVNYHPVSRGPWRLKGAVDSEGHAITSSFLAVRAIEDQLTPQFLWAICNSPITNAFIYCHSLKRNILAGELRQVPVPTATPSGVERVARVAAEYLTYMAKSGLLLQAEPDMAHAKRLLLSMDAELLRLYDLPPRLERQLLDLFEGHPRSGVPFKFTSYYPPGFRPFLPLHLLLSEDYERTTAAKLRARASPEKSTTVLAALSAAVEAFKED
jgi:hypothetical protein